VELGGLTAGTEYDQLAVTGTVALGGALNVSLISSFPPQFDDVFAIIDNDGSDPVIGTFDGLPEGALVSAGAAQFQISYVGGDGNDVVLTASNRPPVANAGGPYLVSEGDDLALDGAGSSDPDGDPLSFTWDVDGDGTFGDALGATPTLTWAALQALGLDVGDPTTVSVRVEDTNGVSDTAVTTLTLQNLVDLSGRVFDDRDNDGVFDPGDGDAGIEGVIMELVNEATGEVARTTATGANGAYHFNRLSLKGSTRFAS
jgi:hypothetical protein